MRHFLVFDIETAPIDWDTFSDSQKEYWLRNANTEEEKEEKMFQRSLTPLTGKVVCIGLMIAEYDGYKWNVIKKGVLSNNQYTCKNPNEISEEIIANDVKMQLSNEYKVLEDFWKILNFYKNPTLISFNGRNFDAPFLMLRSAIHKIRPPLIQHILIIVRHL